MSHRFKDQNWDVEVLDGGKVSHSDAELCVLMDIRDAVNETTNMLHRLNNLLHCPNFTGIPGTLRAIRKNTIKRRRVAK